MKTDITLYCKSFRNDVNRAFYLLKSIEEFNVDRIPFYISTPSEDRNIFKNILGTSGYNWIPDEEIYRSNPRLNLNDLKKISGNITQQIIKAEFWRLKYSKVYLCLDSDAVFIKDFYKKNFVSVDEKAYTVAHDSLEFFKEAENYGKKYIYRNFLQDSNNLKKFFLRDGVNYDFGPSPFIWDKNVWEWLSAMLEEKGMTISDVIKQYGNECRWYGEALLKRKIIEFLPIKPIFKVYHYDWQYAEDKKKGIDNHKLKEDYLGVIIQSNWDEKRNSVYVKKKNILSRTFKKIKNYYLGKN